MQDIKFMVFCISLAGYGQSFHCLNKIGFLQTSYNPMGQWEFIPGTANQGIRQQQEKSFLLSVEMRFVSMVMRSKSLMSCGMHADCSLNRTE